LAWGQGGFS